MAGKEARKRSRVFDEVDDDLLSCALTDAVELGDGEHFVRRDCGVHPPGEDHPVWVDLLEHLRRFASGGVGVAAHIHQGHIVALQLLRELFPIRHRARGENVSLDAVLMEDGAQEAEAMILPLLVRALRMDKIAQVTEVNPHDIRFALGPRPGIRHAKVLRIFVLSMRDIIA
ncbi:MAG: hypothetical protein MUC34_06210 [Anaerolineae bacterium]|nr:hypothetical protein [Anaerolineae bacterium]